MDELAIEGCPIKVRTEGEKTAPALVLSHMLGTDLSLWDKLVPELSKHFFVVRYDTRGHGGSGLGDAPVTLARLGRDVLAILDALGIERAHFCGLSMGGAVGQWLLVHAPARIERAVIAGSAAKIGEPAVWNARIATALADGMEQAVEPTLERWFHPDFAERAPGAVAAVGALVRATSPVGYAACCAALRDMDLREALRAVTHPVLVLRGVDDPSVSAEDAGGLVETMVHASATEVKARHCASIEAEAEFSAAVVKFLTAKIASRRPVAKPAKTASAKKGSAETRPAKMGDQPTARHIGQRGLVAARRPVAQTAPVSGKAVAKASATRKTAARAAPRAPAPARRAAALETARAPARGKDASLDSISANAASGASQGKASDRAKAMRTEAEQDVTSASGKAATSGTARRAATTARKPAARAKPPTTAALRAGADTIEASADKTKTAGPAAGRAKKISAAPVEAAAGRSGEAVKSGAESRKVRALPDRHPPAKPTAELPKPAPSKSAEPSASKPVPTEPAPAKPAANRRTAASAAKPRRPTGRGPAGSGRRKP